MLHLFPKYGFALGAIMCIVNGGYNLFQGYYGWAMLSGLLSIFCITAFRWYLSALSEARD